LTARFEIRCAIYLILAVTWSLQ